MERQYACINTAKEVFKKDFIGYDEILQISKTSKLIPREDEMPIIPYTEEELITFEKNDYFLLLGVSYSNVNTPVTLKLMRSLWGINPQASEPCFYNQDWYLNENFFSDQMVLRKWYLFKKNVIPESRGKLILDLPSTTHNPYACECAYAFFMYYFYNNKAIWPYDYIWCLDRDTNSDQVYVGRYFDKNGINSNGFSIHRFLTINNSYGSIDIRR